MTLEEELVEIGDETPPLSEQARLAGWKGGIFDFGKAEVQNVEHFNPSLIRRPDGLWLIVRRSEVVNGMPYGRNRLWACKLDEKMKPLGGPLLDFPDSTAEEQMEDPRAFRWNGQTWIGVVNFVWFPDGSWTGAHQALFSYRDDEEWTPIVRRDPPVETNLGRGGFTNGKHNKNFLWFLHDDKLHLIYMSDPWQVIEFGATWEEQKGYGGEGVKWKYGHVRGGTTPIRVGDHYITFFHSSMPWRGRFRRYYMGAMAFEAKPPFTPVLWTREPLLTGSQNDPWQQRKPLVVFPCGAIFEKDKWLVSYGINDLKSGWVEIPHEDLQKLLQPIPASPASMLLGMETEKPKEKRIPFVQPVDLKFNHSPDTPPLTAEEIQSITANAAPSFFADEFPNVARIALKQKRQAAMAHARAVAAENRRLGIPPKKKSAKRKRKRLKREGNRRKTLATCQLSPKYKVCSPVMPDQATTSPTG